MGTGTSWNILRMAGPRTLKVVESLRRAGFNVWTPVKMRRTPRPRSTKYRDGQVAVFPTIAFAEACQLPSLLAAQHADVSEHPPFTVLQYQGKYPRATDAALQPLRDHEAEKAAEWEQFCTDEAAAELERRRKKKSRKKGRSNPRRAYVLGQRVKIESSAFTGMTGDVVEKRSNGSLVISLGDGALEITVDTCDLTPVHVDDVLPERALAARRLG